MIKIVASWATLMQYASAVGNAKKFGTIADIQLAENNLRDYEALVLMSDNVNLGITYGDL